jgi:pyridoxamine 5'-phosphate oxidase
MSPLAPSTFGVAPLASALLEDPVAFLSAEHARQVALLGHLERLARAPAARGARQMAAALLRWLTEEWPLHIADEEQSLHPRLRPHDAGGALARLSAEHDRESDLAAQTLAGLRQLVAGGEVVPGTLEAAAAFAGLHRQHLAFEEARITPLARRVLTPEAMRELANEMAARRGLPTATLN